MRVSLPLELLVSSSRAGAAGRRWEEIEARQHQHLPERNNILNETKQWMNINLCLHDILPSTLSLDRKLLIYSRVSLHIQDNPLCSWSYYCLQSILSLISLAMAVFSNQVVYRRLQLWGHLMRTPTVYKRSTFSIFYKIVYSPIICTLLLINDSPTRPAQCVETLP